MSRLSVIIPTYQHASTIGACLDALLKQTRKPDEIIVVDDGSTDDTADRLEPYRRSIVVIHQSNAGAPAARMRGFELSTGDLVLFCDADAILRADALERFETTLKQHSDASYAYSGFRWGRKRFSAVPFDAVKLRQENFIHTTSLIRREHFPGFDLSLKRFQDWDLWLMMLEQRHVGLAIDDVLFDVRHVRGRKGISQWLPSIVYRLPWKRVGWAPARIRAYQNARSIVRQKHHLL